VIGDDRTPPCFDHHNGTMAQWHKFSYLPRLEQRASQSGVYSDDLRLEIKERLIGPWERGGLQRTSGDRLFTCARFDPTSLACLLALKVRVQRN
jgi:hypothetical protein